MSWNNKEEIETTRTVQQCRFELWGLLQIVRLKMFAKLVA